MDDEIATEGEAPPWMVELASKSLESFFQEVDADYAAMLEPIAKVFAAKGPEHPATESRSSLIRTTVTDKNGVTRHVWVHPDEEASPGHEHTETAVLPDLAKQFPQEAADPKLWASVVTHAKVLHEVVYGALVRATPNILSAAHAILDTPEDFAKFGFAPTLSGVQHPPSATDPIREATGLSAHLALSLTSKILSHGFIWAKGRMKTEGLTEDTGSEETAQWIGDLLAEIAEKLGVKVAIDREAILRAVVEKGAK